MSRYELSGKRFSREMEVLWMRSQQVARSQGHRIIYAIDVLAAMTLEPRDGNVHACKVLRENGITLQSLQPHIIIGHYTQDTEERTAASVLDDMAERISGPEITPDNLLIQILQDRTSSAGVAMAAMSINVPQVIRELRAAAVHAA